MNSVAVGSIKYIAVLILLSVLFSGCAKSGGSYGEEIPAGLQVAALQDILNNPLQYHDKKVVLQGILTSQCASLCDFVYQEGSLSQSVFVQGFKAPRLKTGTPIKVHALIVGDGERVVISALGIQVNE